MPMAKESWIEIVLETPSEMSDAISNFLEELGTQGVFQEEGGEDSFENLQASREYEKIKAYLADDTKVERKLDALQGYIRSLSELFPSAKGPPSLPRPLSIQTGRNGGKNILSRSGSARTSS